MKNKVILLYTTFILLIIAWILICIFWYDLLLLYALCTNIIYVCVMSAILIDHHHLLLYLCDEYIPSKKVTGVYDGAYLLSAYQGCTYIKYGGNDIMLNRKVQKGDIVGVYIDETIKYIKCKPLKEEDIKKSGFIVYERSE